jgi:hypothetical protein
MNIIHKKYILFKAYLKYKYDVDSPWHWLHFELHRCFGHSTAILSQGCNVNFVKSRCIFPSNHISTGMKFGTHVVHGSLYLLAPIYSDSLAINVLNFFYPKRPFL